MPWQRQTDGNITCKDATKLDEWRAIWGRLIKMDESELHMETGCIPRCKRKEWTVNKFFEDRVKCANQSKL